MKEWSNWSGSLTFCPKEFLVPKTEDELCKIVKRSREKGRKCRVAGSGHSSSALVETDDILISLDRFKKLEHLDEKKHTATLGAGLTVHESNEVLQKKGYALFNTGDVDVQFLIGAISTGTHGTGKKLQNLSSMLVGVRVVSPEGEIKEYHEDTHPEMMKAFRVSVGSLGIITSFMVKVLPLFKLKRTDIFVSIEDCFRYFDELASENRNVDFYWYPRRDQVKIRILNEPGEGTTRFPFPYHIHKEEEGYVGEILPRHRELKFDETEYAFDASIAMECFKVVRKRIKEKHRKEVAWRTLFRTIAADDVFLSPHFGRDSVTISLHHNAGLPYHDYFDDIEPIFRDFGGRPHWGKKHKMKARDLKKLFPGWEKFHEIRKELDPDRFFMNAYLNDLFIEDE
jgi:FAD/FMN-containing dehydrogenase